MPVEPKFVPGTKVVGLGTRSEIKGKVVDTKETGFGLRYVEILKKDGTKEWLRTTLLAAKKGSKN